MSSPWEETCKTRPLPRWRTRKKPSHYPLGRSEEKRSIARFARLPGREERDTFLLSPLEEDQGNERLLWPVPLPGEGILHLSPVEGGEDKRFPSPAGERTNNTILPLGGG